MKTPSIALLALVSGGIALAQGPLTPPVGYDPNIGPANALDGSGLPQSTMKTLHQVEPRTPLAAGQPGVVQEANGGFTISASGSYYLTRNLTVASGNGITILADRVTLDLNGFSIASSSTTVSGVGIEVSSFHPNLTVRNGFIVGGTTLSGTGHPFTLTPRGFSSGVLSNVAGPAGSFYAATVEDMDVRGCADMGIWVTGGKYQNCTVDGCGGIGLAGSMAADCIVARCGGIYALYADVVTRCEVLENTGDGIQAHSVDQSAAFQNGSVGISASLVTNSKAELNGTTGIDAETVKDCISVDNLGTGIKANVVSGSRAAGNLDHGIYAWGVHEWTGTVTDCSAMDNSSNGIVASTVNNCIGSDNGAGGISARCISNSMAFSNLGNGFGVEGTATNCLARENAQWGFSAHSAVLTQCTAKFNNPTANPIHGGIFCEDGVISFCRSYGNGTTQYSFTSATTFNNR